MILYLMRHGETDWNIRELFQGRTDVPLNANGRQVAAWTREGLKDVTFDVAFCSPLSRAKETADIVLQGRAIDIIVDERLAEIGFGSYEGLEWDCDDNANHFFAKPELYEAPEGAESMEQVLQRAQSFLDELYANPDYQDSTILIATHGGTLNALLCIMDGRSVADYWNGGLHKNCGISIVEVTRAVPKVLKRAITMY